jgi:hypothetical protein
MEKEKDKKGSKGYQTKFCVGNNIKELSTLLQKVGHKTKVLDIYIYSKIN